MPFQIRMLGAPAGHTPKGSANLPSNLRTVANCRASLSCAGCWLGLSLAVGMGDYFLGCDRYAWRVTLLGRLAELAACQQALLAGREGAAAAVITGAPGIGKTTVWRAAAGGQPAGTVVLRTTGLQAGQAGLASLADLLDSVAEAVLPRLPPPQADALRAALGLAVAAPVTMTLLERATVGVLRELAVAGVVVAVDDEQWVDPDSLRLLECAVVRLKDAPVRWLVAVRSGHTGRGLAQVLDHELGAAMTWVDLAGLDEAALSELVMDRFPGRWSPGVLRRVVALAGGSPYAALELARETAARGGRDGTAVHLPATLAESLRSRLDRLSPGALAVVQAAAVAEAPTRALLRAVDGEATDGRVDEALEAGVLDAAPPDPVLRFSHPLLREVAEGMLSGPGRSRLHRAIGAALADPDQAAWHLARGADEPDEKLAERAEQAARHARARGAPARAAVLAQAAAELTPDPDSLQAWQRRLQWLYQLNAAGEFEQVRSLGEKWAVHAPVSLRGYLNEVRAAVEPDFETGCGLLAAAFDDLADRDPTGAARVGIHLGLGRFMLLGPVDAARGPYAAAVAQARLAGDPVVLREALGAQGFAAAAAGDPGAGERLREAVRLPGFADTPFPSDSPEARLALWYLCRGEVDPARDLLQAQIEISQRRGLDEDVIDAEGHLVEVEWRAGRWDAATRYAASVARWDRETGYGQQGPPAYYLALVQASRGDIDPARVLAGHGVELAEAQGDSFYAAACRWVLGLIELSVDDPAAALRWLDPIADMLQDGGIGEPGAFPFTPDLIEAWAATGQLDRAADRLAWLQDAAARLDHPWARITSGRAEAALRLAQRDPGAAIRAVAAVIPEARERGLPFELGRCLLVLGTAQRKARQRRAAAATLDEAAAAFDRLGARRWQALAQAQRARLAPGHDDSLTPAERRIADLVATGHTNPEIAATLYVSVKTVEANLTRIYRKLGLRSRVDLARSHPS
jgi:DNA-binding CsgD family transcriptional regulator